MPNQRKVNKQASVTIVPPSWTESVYGNGTFQLALPYVQSRPLSSDVALCGKTIFNLDDVTTNQIKLFLSFYRNKGVKHFTFYAIESDPDFEDIRSELKRSDAGHNDITFIVFPTTYMSKGLYGKKIKDLQKYTTNDCLWRERANHAEWTMMQFDLDEYLGGIDDLPRFLSSLSSDAIHIKQFLPKELEPFPEQGTEIYAAETIKWGKTIFRTEKVNVAWVHAPTNPAQHLERSKRAKLLHFRRNTTALINRLKRRGNITWTQVTF
uniref:Glycosyltransferase family 92 protein n=1 Tax=Odontella aurita TaxID=265563 RepID=A0A7S4NHC2_9STRA|mmetsp:Transcript_63537/g.187571  ORF Transcript_63537/g.187571 Transcript_63537/m.187571 type:complete len:266 (+) Transcript_63537:630-1427(+)